MTIHEAIGNLLDEFSARVQLENTQIMTEIMDAHKNGDTDQVKAKLWALADEEDKDFEETILSEKIRNLADSL